MQGVYGFLNMLARLLTDHRPRGLAIAVDDDWRPAFRVDALPSYKTHRVATEDGRRGSGRAAGSRRPRGAAGARLRGRRRRRLRGRGRDRDARGALRAAGRRSSRATATSSRSSAIPTCYVLYPQTGVSKLVVVDEAEVTRRYGIPGRAYGDFALLRGDPSDGLPGVKGIGEKTAREARRRARLARRDPRRHRSPPAAAAQARRRTRLPRRRPARGVAGRRRAAAAGVARAAGDRRRRRGARLGSPRTGSTSPDRARAAVARGTGGARLTLATASGRVTRSWLVALAVGSLLFARYYRSRVVQSARAALQETPLLAHLRASLSRAHRRRIRPPLVGVQSPPPARALAWRDARDAAARFDHERALTLADGGTVSLDWLGRSTIRSDADARRAADDLRRRSVDAPRWSATSRRRLGWRIVVCNRRGHGTLPLTAPRFSTLGATDDVRAPARPHPLRACPPSPLYGLGVVRGLRPPRPLPRRGRRAYAAHGRDRVLPRLRHDARLSSHPPALRSLPDRGGAAVLRRASRGRPRPPARLGRDPGEPHGRRAARPPAPVRGLRLDAPSTTRHTNPMVVADAVGIPLTDPERRRRPVCTVANVDEHRGLFAPRPGQPARAHARAAATAPSSKVTGGRSSWATA